MMDTGSLNTKPPPKFHCQLVKVPKIVEVLSVKVTSAGVQSMESLAVKAAVTLDTAMAVLRTAVSRQLAKLSMATKVTVVGCSPGSGKKMVGSNVVVSDRVPALVLQM